MNAHDKDFLGPAGDIAVVRYGDGELTVIKRSGRRVPFERVKLESSVAIAIRKRPIEPARVERMVSGIVRQLESMGESEIPSSAIGELLMEGLKNLDPVAYVRFASVYRDFREAADFHEVLGEIADAAKDQPDLAQAAPATSNPAGKP